MDDTAILIKEINRQNGLNDWVAEELRREVYVSVQGVTRTEHFKAAEAGLSPEAVLVTSLYDYDGETLLEWRGQKYAIYRSRQSPERDEVELYIERQGGISGETSQCDQSGWAL